MQKKLFLVLFGMIALVSFPTMQTFGEEDGPVVALICNPNRSINWSSPNYHPEVGDKIVAVNGVRVHNEGEFRKEVRNSPRTIILGVLDHRTNQLYHLKTRLWSQDNQTRLGIYVRNSQNPDAVVVTGCMPNSPGMHCQYVTDEITPVQK